MVCAQCHIRGLSRETFTDFLTETTPQAPGRAPFPVILVLRIKTSADDNTLCLSCHAGQGIFADITMEEVADVWLNGPSANLKNIVIQHTQHVYNPQGDEIDPVLGIPGDDLGDLKTSNCVECHMPFTAKTALEWDIHAHTFNIIRPEQSLSTSPSAGVPNSCNQCHDALTDEELQASQADYAAKFPLNEAGEIDPAVRTNPYVDEWLQSGHADFAGLPFNDWNADGEIPTTCAKCHSAAGFRDFAVDGQVTRAIPSNPVRDPQLVVDCSGCHSQGDNPAFWTNDNTLWDDRGTFTALDPVTFPSGATQTLGDASNICMACHQGRSSGVQVAAAIEARDQNPFINRHYFAAAAILFGSEVDAGFEYRDKAQYVGQNTFPGHAANLKTCTGCHLRLGVARRSSRSYLRADAERLQQLPSGSDGRFRAARCPLRGRQYRLRWRRDRRKLPGGDRRLCR